MNIPDRILKIFRENPSIKIVVDGKDRYYRGLKAYLREHSPIETTHQASV